MEDTWFSRDLPVLDATVRLLDEGNPGVSVADIAKATGLDVWAVDRALDALEGPYVVEYNRMMGGNPEPSFVAKVSAAARQAVGQWPTPEGLVDALAEAFGKAAEHEPDAEKKSRLRQVGAFLGSTGRGVATEVVSQVILRSAGMG